MSLHITIQVEIFSFWHAGSGLGRSGFEDAQALRDTDGLPYLPGRTLKGLLREGVAQAADYGQLPSGRAAADLFGVADSAEKANHDTGLFFGDARLDAATRQWLAVNPAGREFLFQPFSSTKLDEDGQADDHTLRQVELAVPMTLLADAVVPDETTLRDLRAGAAMVRHLGSHRHRGLGRCRITLQETKAS